MHAWQGAASALAVLLAGAVSVWAAILGPEELAAMLLLQARSIRPLYAPIDSSTTIVLCCTCVLWQVVLVTANNAN